MKKGRLISFEGLDGSGKTTQITMLENWLKEHDISYVLTREPGGTLFGIRIRELLLMSAPTLGIDVLTEALLFQADRAQHFAELIIPALEDGKLVITDRCFDATIAYQGYARGMERKLVKKLSLIAMQGYKPDLTILLDLDPIKVHKRVGLQLPLPFPTDGTYNQNGVREDPNRLDKETLNFHRRVRNGFLALAKNDQRRIKKINALLPPKDIHEQIVGLIWQFLYDASNFETNAANKASRKREDRKQSTVWAQEELLSKDFA